MFAMLSEALECVSTSVVRRLLFASSNLPSDTPNRWSRVAKFSTLHCPEEDKASLSPETCQLIAENTSYFDDKAYLTDGELLVELAHMKSEEGGNVGLVLMSEKKVCCKCGRKLLV